MKWLGWAGPAAARFSAGGLGMTSVVPFVSAIAEEPMKHSHIDTGVGLTLRMSSATITLADMSSRLRFACVSLSAHWAARRV